MTNHITAIRASIQQHYASLIDAIKHRESQLLLELSSIEQTYRQEYQKYWTTIDELEKTKMSTVKIICAEDINDLRDSVVKQVDERLTSIKLNIESKNIAFKWDTNLADEILQIGRLITSDGFIDYKRKLILSLKLANKDLVLERFTMPWE